MDILGNIQNYIPNGKEFYALRDPAGAFQSQTQMTGTEMANGSFNEEAVKEGQRTLTEAAREEALRQDPTLSFVTRELAKGLLGSKLNYMAAQGKGDAAGMRQAEDAARSIREQGKAIGWDGAGFGSDVTYEQAAQNLMNNDARAINDLFYGGMSANDYYNKQYEDMRKFGLGRKTADEEATRMTDSYLQQRTNQMMDAFQAYGMDDRGVINQNGLRILGMLGQLGNGDIANLYAKMNPSPAQNWNFGNSLITAANAQQNALARMDRQAAEAANARREGYQQSRDMAYLQNELAKEKAAFTAQLNIATQGMSMEQKRNAAYNEFFRLTGDENQAQQLTAEYMLGLGRGDSSRGSTDGSAVSSKEEKRRADLLSKINPVIHDFMSGKIGKDEYDSEMSKYTPQLDENDQYTLQKDIPYVKQFLDEYALDPNSTNTMRYYKYIMDDESNMEFVPEDVQNFMEERLRKEGK